MTVPHRFRSFFEILIERGVETLHFRHRRCERKGILLTPRVLPVEQAEDGCAGRGFVAFHMRPGGLADVKDGETFGLVGESGCGKTTLGRVIMRMYPVTDGSVVFEGDDIKDVDRKTLARRMQIIFQDPYGSLDPRLTVGGIINEGLEVHEVGTEAERADRVSETMNVVGISSHYAQRYPHEFSGGQRQRIGIARALVLQPKFIVCDEPVSALDVSIQSQILNLLRELQSQMGLTYLFIAHNLAVVKYMADRIGVMYLGQVVEQSATAELFANPLHPYTQGLMSAIPTPDPSQTRDRIVLKGEIPSPMDPPTGCRFSSRCQYADSICTEVDPVFKDYGNDHLVACHMVDTELSGGRWQARPNTN